MALQVGIDLVDIEEIEGSIATHGERFLCRVYTAAERAEAHGDPRQLAARFAAKEATMKALRTSDTGLGWGSIEVLAHGAGHSVNLTGAAAALAQTRGLRGLSVSLSVGRRQASAAVIAELER